MAKNKVSTNINPKGSTTTETYSVESRGKTHTVSITRRTFGDYARFGSSIFGLFVFILLFVNLVKLLIDGSPVSFLGFLDVVSNSPVLDMSLTNFNVLSYVGDWGVFNFLATFINWHIDLINVVIYFSKGIYNCIVYLIYFIKFIFV